MWRLNQFSVLAVLAVASGQVRGQAIIDDFESGSLSNWNVCYASGGVWQVVSPGHNSNFAATFNAPSCGFGSGTLRHNTFSAGFGRYSYDLYFETGGVPDGGLFLQIANVSDFYYLQLGPQGGDNGDDRMHAIQSGVPTVVGCAPVSLTTGVWHTIVVERFPNGVMRVYLDGVLKITASDTTYMGAGGLALRAYTCGVRFDNISFTPTLPPSPSPPGPPSCGGPNGLASPCANCSGGAFCGDGSCCPGENSCTCPGDCPGTCTPPAVPTVSEWGLVVMTLIGLSLGTVFYGRRRFSRG